MKRIYTILLLLVTVSGVAQNIQPGKPYRSPLSNMVADSAWTGRQILIPAYTSPTLGLWADRPGQSFGFRTSNNRLTVRGSGVWVDFPSTVEVQTMITAGSPVASVFGRTGSVAAQSADYSPFYPQLSGSYSNPSWITDLAWSKITGAPSNILNQSSTGQSANFWITGNGRTDGAFSINTSLTDYSFNVLRSSGAVARFSNNAALNFFSGAVIRLETTNTPTAADQRIGQINFGTSSSQASVQLAAHAQGAHTDGSSQPAYFLIYTTPSGSATPLERFRIAADGQVSIGANISSPATPTVGNHLTNKTYVDAQDALKVPTTRTLSINGTSFDLSANRSWTITESDPTVPAYAKTLNNFNVIQASTDALYDRSANKQNSLAVDGTATKYPTVDAVNAALAAKADASTVSGKANISGGNNFSGNQNVQGTVSSADGVTYYSTIGGLTYSGPSQAGYLELTNRNTALSTTIYKLNFRPDPLMQSDANITGPLTSGRLALAVSPVDYEVTDATKGMILKSPDGTRWRITVSNAGVLTATSL